jgi:23S rRNA pseudouridine1911/1915/1917 synthase
MAQYNITSEFSGVRLDKFLVTQFPELSRSQIQKMIKSGAVLLNNKPTAVHHFLKAGDMVSISEQTSIISQTHPAVDAFPRQKPPAPEIIADTPDYLIIDKPAGLLAHEAPGTDEPTLVDWLLEKYPDLKKIGEDPSRPAIVHRLDKEVSGLMVIPKTQAMFDHLKSQFKTRRIKKEYIALIYGKPEKLEGEIDFNIDRSVKGHKMAAVPHSEDDELTRGRPAVTQFEVLEQYGQYSLLKITPYTGRTHQIRVHLNAYGLPIVGDKIYKPRKLKEKLKINRLFLHAATLGFFDRENNWQEFQAPLPDALQSQLKTLQG